MFLFPLKQFQPCPKLWKGHIILLNFVYFIQSYEYMLEFSEDNFINQALITKHIWISSIKIHKRVKFYNA